ncbi:sporulation protein YqfC [Fonticella tunisiensis]|uniref:Sporulation protein YqfC n=1 Tax=Fonticella tunisiensis TaxID=1096341 RepID=A0A4R7KCM5_9CLOT|nr:sporulation protein YqfC [Fonticella tunisiensis]TDT51099.1 sporulation protein YqfC [Fonticella tunisiensis]
MKNNIKSRFADSLELPKEVVLDTPMVRITGNNEMSVENHRGIVEYSKEILRINSTLGIIKVSGSFLNIKEINQENIIISGEISSIEYIK